MYTFSNTNYNKNKLNDLRSISSNNLFYIDLRYTSLNIELLNREYYCLHYHDYYLFNDDKDYNFNDISESDNSLGNLYDASIDRSQYSLPNYS